MDNILSRIYKPFSLGSKSAQNTNRDEVIIELRAIRDQINCTQAFFENECDDDMIEACVYELEALKARHRYLTKLLRLCEQKSN